MLSMQQKNVPLGQFPADLRSNLLPLVFKKLEMEGM